VPDLLQTYKVLSFLFSCDVLHDVPPSQQPIFQHKCQIGRHVKHLFL
jgi:hypothetical protein